MVPVPAAARAALAGLVDLAGHRRHWWWGPRQRQVIVHVGLPDGYHGVVGPLLAGLEVDLGRLREAVAAELRRSQR